MASIFRDGKEINLTPDEENRIFMSHIRDHVECSVEDYLNRDYDKYYELTNVRQREIIVGIADVIMDKIEDLDFDIFDDEKIEWEVDDAVEYDEDYSDLNDDKEDE